MKRVRCPKCENYLTFDETKYTEGQSLVFVCEHCKKQFAIRLGKAKVQATRKDEQLNENEFKDAFGNITVIENVFGFKQVLPLQEGDNIIGRRCIGNNIQVPIETSDMSMDRYHCIINVKRNKQGKLVYTLRDAPSLTGTFLNNEILGDKDRVRIEEGARGYHLHSAYGRNPPSSPYYAIKARSLYHMVRAFKQIRPFPSLFPTKSSQFGKQLAIHFLNHDLVFAQQPAQTQIKVLVRQFRQLLQLFQGHSLRTVQGIPKKACQLSCLFFQHNHLLYFN